MKAISARTSGFLVFGDGAVAGLLGVGPTLRGGLARVFAAYDHAPGDRGAGERLRSMTRHFRSNRGALLPALGPGGAETALFGAAPPRAGALPSFFNP